MGDPIAEHPDASVPGDTARAPSTLAEVLAIAPLAWLTVAIDSRMSAELRARLTAEDVAQEVLAAYWEARDRFEWRGPKALRSYLLTLADRAITGAADHHFAAKRGGAAPGPGPLHSSTPGLGTTPSRAAGRHERAELMRQALAALPDEYRECIRLRLFEEQPLKAIAAALGVPESTVRRRVRTGSELYAARLRDALATRTATIAQTELAQIATVRGRESHSS